MEDSIVGTYSRSNKSYSRRIGRALTSHQKQLVDYMPSEEELFSYINNIKEQTRVVLEIGFGNGDNLLKLANIDRDTIFIGCEPFINGVAKVLKTVCETKLDNIRIYPGDIKVLLDNIVNRRIFDQIYILFPDPWPKSKHNKRRLVTASFIESLLSFLKSFGQIILATDDVNYANYIAKELKKLPDLIIEQSVYENRFLKNKDMEMINNKFFLTKYAKRGISLGNDIYLFTLRIN